MTFKNREEAAKKLAEKLLKYRGIPDAVVVALPRGGVVLGRIVANALGLPLDIVVPRKIGAPGNEEYAIGAITETKDMVWNESERARTSEASLAKTIAAEAREAERRLKLYRAGLPPRMLKQKTVIMVDDGIATGFTMRAALRTVKRERVKKIIVAVPVCAPDTFDILQREADEIIALEKPAFFTAIGNFYEQFPQVPDEQVVNLLHR